MNTAIEERKPAARQPAPVDPAVKAWAEDLDAWLQTPEGDRWLDSQAEMDAERRGITLWEGRAW